MTKSVTILSTDFMPLINSHEFVFIFFTKTDEGKLYNIEEVGTKTEICKKYGITDLNFQYWNEKTFKDRRCKIRISRLRFRKNKFISFLDMATAA